MVWGHGPSTCFHLSAALLALWAAGVTRTQVTFFVRFFGRSASPTAEWVCCPALRPLLTTISDRANEG